MYRENVGKIIIITGGHHSSSIPVIERLKSTNPNLKIIWFGHKHSLRDDKNSTLEYLEITKLNIPFVNLNAGKVYKTYDLFMLLRVPFGFFQAFYYLIKFKPNLILSFGGYLAVPVVIAGWFLGIPSITHEQTVVTGYANKFISLFVKKILISWSESEKFFTGGKVIYSGIPLRKAISYSASNLFVFNNELPIIYIMGGKTGSHKLNLIILNEMDKVLKFCNVIHQCGDNSLFDDYSKLLNRYKELKDVVVGRYFVKKFIFENEIGEAYSKADLIVSRSGAHTVAEILYLEKPAILVPIPWASHNEQYENAKILKNSGLAEIYEEKNLLLGNFSEYLRKVLENRFIYKLKDVSLKKLVTINSANIISEEVLKMLREYAVQKN